MTFKINDYSVVVVRCCLLVETQMSWKHFIWDQSMTMEVDNFFGWITWFSGGTERGSVVANKVYITEHYGVSVKNYRNTTEILQPTLPWP